MHSRLPPVNIPKYIDDTTEREEGAPKKTANVEVTEEMRRAGARAYYEFDLRFGEVEDCVTSIFVAMAALAK